MILALVRRWRFSWRWAALLAAGLALALGPLPRLPGLPGKRTIRIEASQFVYTPASLAVKPGDQVNLELVATDVVHGLALDGYGLSATAEPGRPAHLSFTADKPGVFRFRCTTTCGPLHPFMVGQLRVGGDDLLWRAAGLAVLAAVAGLWRGRR